ncbi:MAG: hypothetical protein C0506_09240 [Anaerolinea sp.]|nr:hypothetical protein [Anaerolinea sp.]
MNRISILGIAAAFALGMATLVAAGTATGTTTIIGPTGGPADGQAHEDTPTDVEVTISTTAPVVPYEYSVINKCWFSGKTSGPSDSFERFDLAGPWFEPEPGDPPTMIVSVNVQPVPEGAKCKVYLIKNNTVVKGSTTTYSVVGP